MTCEECQDNIIFYLSHQLTTAEEREVERHLNACEGCRRELELNERFARGVHNVSIPLRRAAERIEDRLLASPGVLAAENSGHRFARLVRTRPRAFTLAGIGAILAVAAVAVFLFGRNDVQIDPLTTWAIQHYPLIDQTHSLRGDASTVRTWFRDHHQVNIVPPRNVDYAELVGCKMIELNSEPAPLLRFDGPDPCAVFILPARFKDLVGEGAEIGLEKDGFRIRLWIEGNQPYLRISKAREA